MSGERLSMLFWALPEHKFLLDSLRYSVLESDSYGGVQHENCQPTALRARPLRLVCLSAKAKVPPMTLHYREIGKEVGRLEEY